MSWRDGGADFKSARPAAVPAARFRAGRSGRPRGRQILNLPYKRVAIVIAATIAIAWAFLPPPPALPPISYSRQVFARDGRLLAITLTPGDKYRLHAPLSEISPQLIAATLLHEDRWFWKHPGINPWATLRATADFLLGRTDRGGASTITMQLARMRYGIDSRRPRGKLLQMFRALQIERHRTKADILEEYLNVAPYGGNLEGVGAASLFYFRKPAANLTVHEAIALSVIPQSPARRAPGKLHPSPSAEAARQRLYAALAAPGTDADFVIRSASRPATLAPHFVRRVLAENLNASAIQTTLDIDAQRCLERTITRTITANRLRGVRNAAAMLLDTESMEVRAQVGSADFFSEAISGQVDGTLARRSPGSTLKPFIYALAMDQGRIHPLSVLADAPHNFAGYEPENFDGEFAGPIAAGDALSRSRNVPAVSLASELSHPTLYEFLKRGGVALPREESFYGLALPLGGGEVTLEELVRLYAMLTNGGRLRAIERIDRGEHERNSLSTNHANDTNVKRLMDEHAPSRGITTNARQPSSIRAHSCDSRTSFPPSAHPASLTPESAFLTLEMLGGATRPGSNSPAGDEGIYWKTGTSHGFRDAWSVAVFGHYVLAVWVGNFDGRGSPTFIGRTCAGPLLFQSIDALRASLKIQTPRLVPPPGANLRRVEFCAVSGQLPTSACAHRTPGWFIPGISPITACTVHREVLLDATTDLRVSTADGTRSIRREVFEFWPSDLLALFAKAGLPRRRPPPFLPGEGLEIASRSGRAPGILSPKPGQTYAIRATQRTLSLRAETDADVRDVYWFAGSALLGSAPARGSLPWQPEPGTHRLLALDDHGRAASLTITVEAVAGE